MVGTPQADVARVESTSSAIPLGAMPTAALTRERAGCAQRKTGALCVGLSAP